MQQRAVDDDDDGDVEDGIDAVASTATSPAPVDPGAAVTPVAGSLDAGRHSTKVPRSGSEADEPLGRGQEHRPRVRGRGEPAVSALAGPEPRGEGGDRAERGLDRLLDDRLPPGNADQAGRQREQGVGDRLHDHQADLVREPVAGHLSRAESPQYLGRGARGEGGRGGEQRDGLDGGIHRAWPAEPARFPGDVRRRDIHRELALPVGGPRRQLSVPGQGQDVEHRGGGRHHRHEDVRELVVARALPDQLRVRIQQRWLQLLHDHPDEEHRHRGVHLEAGTCLPRRRALLLVHGDTDQLHQRRHLLQPGAGGVRRQGRLGSCRRSGHHRPGRRALRRVLREQQHQQRRAQESLGALRLLVEGHQEEVHDQHTKVFQRRGPPGIGIHLTESQVHLNGEFLFLLSLPF